MSDSTKNIKEILTLAKEKIDSEEYEKIRQEYKMAEPSGLTPRKHQLITGKAYNLVSRAIMFGTEEEVDLALKYLYVCMDAMKYNLDYLRFSRENHIGKLEDKYVTKARERIQTMKNVVNK